MFSITGTANRALQATSKISLPSLNLSPYPKILVCLLATFALLLISGCESRGGAEQTAIYEAMPEEEAERLLWLAERAPPAEQPTLFLQALTIYFDRNDLENSHRVINRLSAYALTTPQYEKLSLFAASLALNQNDPDTALSYFENAPIDAFTSAPLEIQLQATELQAEALYLNAKYLASAQIRVFNSGLYTGEKYWNNQNQIWRALRAAPSLGISKALEKAHDYSWQGWLELITRVRQNQFSLELQLTALKQWQRDWPDHEANLQLPAELAMLSNLPQMRPKKLALVLPLTGKFAKVGAAVRDGFLAAYYNDKSSGTIIDIIDSETYHTAIDQYLELQLEGYDLIIGPLQKDAVNDLALLPQLHPPVLALNYLDQQAEAIQGLYQFGLSAEDEIRQILTLLESLKKQHIAVIYQDSHWANKLVQLIRKWSVQSAKPPVLTFQFNDSDNISEGMANFLQIEASKARAQQLSRLLGKLEFKPRRREDIDAVILLTSPSQARQIKPLLAFHYAGNIPVYAPSRLYSGISRPSKDHDLDGILYTEVPWLLSKTSPLHEDISYLAGNSHYERLYAMGTDAWLLAPRLQLLTSFPESKVQGLTGNLSMDEHLQVRRELEWATFDRGVVKAQLGYQRSGR